MRPGRYLSECEVGPPPRTTFSINRYTYVHRPTQTHLHTQLIPTHTATHSSTNTTPFPSGRYTTYSCSEVRNHTYGSR